MKFIGTVEEAIYSNFKELLENSEVYETMNKACNLYADGHACERITDIFKGKDYLDWNPT